MLLGDLGVDLRSWDPQGDRTERMGRSSQRDIAHNTARV